MTWPATRAPTRPPAWPPPAGGVVPELLCSLPPGLRRLQPAERELQGHESHQLAAETQALTQPTQQDSTCRVGERLQDTHSWKSELQREVEALAAETDLLLAQKKRLERALDAMEVPFSIATDNMQCSQRHQHANLVRDHVETELLKVPAALGGQDLWAQRGGAPGSSCGQATCCCKHTGDQPSVCETPESRNLAP